MSEGPGSRTADQVRGPNGSQADPPTVELGPPADRTPVAAGLGQLMERPELAVAAAFAGGLLLRALLRRRKRS